MVMRSIKRLIPNNLKQEAKYFLYDLLKIKYNRQGVGLEVEKYMPRDRPITFIDIGASVGNYALPLSKYYQVKKGILIEPVAKWIDLLHQRFPDKQAYRIYNVALAAENGIANFNVFEDNDYMSSFLEFDGKYSDPSLKSLDHLTVAVETKTLDTIVEENHLDRVDLLKIDVQGTEDTVLRAGLNALKKIRLVYIEVSFKPMYHGSCTFFDIYQLMTENNFKLLSLKEGYAMPNGELLQGDALFMNNALE